MRVWPTAPKWSYWLEPIDQVYRLREEIEDGRNHRIIGWVQKEEDARLICDAVNKLATIVAGTVP
jgi:hypothetical protein